MFWQLFAEADVAIRAISEKMGSKPYFFGDRFDFNTSLMFVI
jgi:hypothetical protein